MVRNLLFSCALRRPLNFAELSYALVFFELDDNTRIRRLTLHCHMTQIGYVRIATTDESADTEVERLKAAGCEVVRVERVPGRRRKGRMVLATILNFLRPGDSLVAVTLDRLGRSAHVLNLIHELDQKGASLRILNPKVSTVRPAERLVLLGMVAEMELNFIKARHAAGIAKAKAAGVYKGRAISLDYGRIKALRSQGLGPTAIAKQLGCSRNAVYKVMSTN